MEHERTRIWDLLFKSDPQTIEQIAATLEMNQEMVNMAVDHEWFERQGEAVTIATNKG